MHSSVSSLRLASTIFARVFGRSLSDAEARTVWSEWEANFGSACFYKAFEDCRNERCTKSHDSVPSEEARRSWLESVKTKL